MDKSNWFLIFERPKRREEEREEKREEEEQEEKNKRSQAKRYRYMTFAWILV